MSKEYLASLGAVRSATSAAAIRQSALYSTSVGTTITSSGGGKGGRAEKEDNGLSAEAQETQPLL